MSGDVFDDIREKLRRCTERLNTSLIPWWIAGEQDRPENQEQQAESPPLEDSGSQS